MEASYNTGTIPCPIIGGSAGGKLDFKNTYIYDGTSIKETHAVMTFLKLKPDFRFGIFSSHNFEKTNKSYIILNCNVALRTIRQVYDSNSKTNISFIKSLCNDLRCSPELLEDSLSEYTFGVQIGEEIFEQSVASINIEEDYISFYTDIDAGDTLLLLKKKDFIQTTNSHYKNYSKNKPKPIGGILNDCILRRLLNGDKLRDMKTFNDTTCAGFSTFGELVGINVNQTLTALFFYNISDYTGDFYDEIIDNFLIKYSNFKSYFLNRKLGRERLISNIYSGILSNVFESSQIMMNLSKAFHSATGQMNNNLENLVEVMHKLGSFSKLIESNGIENSTILEQLKDLSDQVSEVDGIIKTITDIAELTGVLSINASIEAARAGDHGKGFAVVASEVRKLSEQISVNLKNIDTTNSSITKTMDHISVSISSSGGHLDLTLSENKDIYSNTNRILNDIKDTKDQLEKEDKDVQSIVLYLDQLKESRVIIDMLKNNF